MSAPPAAAKIGFAEWSRLFAGEAGRRPDGTRLQAPRCFTELDGDRRLKSLQFDNSPAAFRLWSFLLSENDRLAEARRAGRKIIGAMKDLGTVPVIAYASSRAVAFYPDGAWWIPCLMEMSEGLLRIADAAGFGEEVCPVRASLAAMINGAHFPRPDLLIGAVGACCDDMSCVMQRLADLGIPLAWWELPYRRDGVTPELVAFTAGQIGLVRSAIEAAVGEPITDDMLRASIRRANRVRRTLGRIRDLVYGADAPALARARDADLGDARPPFLLGPGGMPVRPGGYSGRRRAADRGRGKRPSRGARPRRLGQPRRRPAGDEHPRGIGRPAVRDGIPLPPRARSPSPRTCPPMQALARSAPWRSDGRPGGATGRRICPTKPSATGRKAVVVCADTRARATAPSKGPSSARTIRGRSACRSLEIEVPPLIATRRSAAAIPASRRSVETIRPRRAHA